MVSSQSLARTVFSKVSQERGSSESHSVVLVPCARAGVSSSAVIKIIGMRHVSQEVGANPIDGNKVSRFCNDVMKNETNGNA